VCYASKSHPELIDAILEAAVDKDDSSMVAEAKAADATIVFSYNCNWWNILEINHFGGEPIYIPQFTLTAINTSGKQSSSSSSSSSSNSAVETSRISKESSSASTTINSQRLRGRGDS